MPEWFAVLAFALVILLLLVLVWKTMRPNPAGETALQARLETLAQNQRDTVTDLRQDHERQAAQLRSELAEQLTRTARGHAEQNAQASQQVLTLMQHFEQRLAQTQGDLNSRFEALRDTIAAQLNLAQQDARNGREEQATQLARFRSELAERLTQMAKGSEEKLEAVRGTVQQQLQALQQDNSVKLEKMRETVDEKLHATLEKRLGESFQLVSTRLEQVQKGLGEMQQLATGVGDLKRVLTNVKTRGTWGEVQLGSLLEQILSSEQYAQNVATRPRSNERVEFAIRMPGKNDDEPVWLPIDAKFPVEDYQRLLDAQERADVAAVEESAKLLEARLRQEARSIHDKYIAPPHTTDFGILYLPTEGLYAEALRRNGLAETLQRDYRIVIAGPTTLSALLNSLQMGFRTLAIEKRSSEVWQVLGAVKTEFSKFGDVLAKTKDKLRQAGDQIEKAEVRTRAIARKLKGVEALPGAEAQQLIGADDEVMADDDTE